ncbi:MAG: Flp family type IVb pilin [Roseiflexaceae bacterium]|jgi:pilus assembly protein Flp/PilA
MLHSFFAKEAGQGLVEYALILALIAIVVVGAVAFIGQRTSSTFNRMGTMMPTN